MKLDPGHQWMPSRRAYTPRFLPTATVAVVMVVGLNLFVDLSNWEAFLASLGISAVVMNGRWVVWRRRHPVLTFEERRHVGTQNGRP